MNDHYDAIIIGTGAGGGTLLNKLAPSGNRILVLERGPFLPREKENWWLTSEDLPDPNNRITLNRDGNIGADYTENNTPAFDRLMARWTETLKSIGCGCHSLPNGKYFNAGTVKTFTMKLGINGLGHQVGTCRFGDDPKASVLDLNCKAHDLDNPYVVDGGFMVTSAAVNPTLTIIANALRVGDHLLDLLQHLLQSRTVPDDVVHAERRRDFFAQIKILQFEPFLEQRDFFEGPRVGDAHRGVIGEDAQPLEIFIAQHSGVEEGQHAQHFATERERLRGDGLHLLALDPFRISNPLLVAAHAGQDYWTCRCRPMP